MGGTTTGTTRAHTFTILFLAFLAAAVAMRPRSVGAQTTTDPRTLQFTASPDHDAVNPDGTPVVQSYRLDLYYAGATAPFQTINLGKPTPDSTNTITLDMSTLFAGWPIPGTTYVSDVAAVGSTGTSPSTLSNPFTFTSQCGATVSPLSLSEPAGGGSATATVTPSSTTCQWSAVSGASWITVSTGASGTGNGTVTFSVAANTASTERTGSLEIAGQTVTVTEAGTCAFTVSPTSQSEPAAGGSAAVSVTTTSGCSWTAASNVSWITIASGTSGSGSATVTYNVAANPTTAARSGTLTIAGQAVTVTQDATQVLQACSYSVSPTTVRISLSGGTASVSVATTSTCAWSATSNDSWITITNGASGTGNGTVTVSAGAAKKRRTGSITVAGTTVTVQQRR